MPRLRLPEELRPHLRKPLGELVVGSGESCMAELKRTIEVEKPSKLVLVGDVVSRNAHAANVKADLSIIDNREMRRPSPAFSLPCERTFRVVNRPGTIELAAWKAVEEGVNSDNAVIVVEGEEDLLALPSIASAPVNSLVVYGQPGEGIVLVRVTKHKKDEVASMLASMIWED